MPRLLLVAGGVVLGVVFVFGLAWVVADDDEPSEDRVPEFSFPAVAHDPAAADALVAAWERWRTATFVTVGQWSRVLDGDDAPLEGPTYMAQNPPRRVSVRLGSVIEEIDETVARCALGSDEVIVPECVAGATARTYDDRVADEMVVVGEYVTGDERLYDVGFGELPGCFRVELEAALLRASWGRWSEFCFDAESGVMVSARTRRPSAVDNEVTLEIRTDVTDLDFAVGS